MSVDISIAICTRNRRDLLARALDSIEKLKVPDGLTYEVLVVDNGSTIDDTHDIVQAFVERHPGKYAYYFEPRKGLSYARNSAVERARAEIIAFTDDDVVVDERWLETIRDAFAAHPEVAAIQGKILLREEKTDSVPPWLVEERMFVHPYYDRGPTPHYCGSLVGANMAILKHMFQKYGLFDVHLGAGASGSHEDTEFGMRLKEGGEKLLYQPAVVVVHEYYPERMTQEYVWERCAKVASSKAYVDVVLRSRMFIAIQARWRLIRYFVRRFLCRITGNQRKYYRYELKAHYWKHYIAELAKLRGRDRLAHRHLVIRRRAL
jgi:glycosyltransferase involved in cell wall biosynthesis